MDPAGESATGQILQSVGLLHDGLGGNCVDEWHVRMADHLLASAATAR